MSAPEVVNFDLLGPCFYRVVDVRAPRKGEWYLSGAIVTAYRTPNDLSTVYTIVEPTFRAKRVQSWAQGEPV